MAGPTSPTASLLRRYYRPLLVAAFVAAWIVATAVAIAASGERGADSEARLTERATAALRAGDASMFDELLLDGADHAFADEYVTRLRAAGTPELERAGPGVVRIRSGTLSTTLSVTEQDGRWYLSLLPPG